MKTMTQNDVLANMETHDGASHICRTDKIIVARMVERITEADVIGVTPEDILTAFDEATGPRWVADDPQSVVAAVCDFLGVDSDTVF